MAYPPRRAIWQYLRKWEPRTFLHVAIPLVGTGPTGVCARIHACVGKDALRALVYGSSRLGTTAVSSVRDGDTNQQYIHTVEHQANLDKTAAAVQEKRFSSNVQMKKARGMARSRICFTCVEMRRRKRDSSRNSRSPSHGCCSKCHRHLKQ